MHAAPQTEPPKTELVLRPAGHGDRAFVVALGGRAFGHLGDYAAIMGGWFDHPEVAGAIAELGGSPVGFALWAFTQEAAGRPIVFDLIGIAVEPACRRRGVGRALIRRALADGREAGDRLLATRAALSVDVANDAARRLFLSEGFGDSEDPPIRYPAGQVATRMVRPLRGVSRTDAGAAGPPEGSA